MAYPYDDNEIAIEPLHAKVSEDVGTRKAFKVLFTDGLGNPLYAESLSWEERFDYDTRTDGQPVYMGYAKQQSLTAAAVWLVHKFTYNASGFVTLREVRKDVSWDGRVAAF